MASVEFLVSLRVVFFIQFENNKLFFQPKIAIPTLVAFTFTVDKSYAKVLILIRYV